MQYIRRFYPNAIIVAGLRELQDTPAKRINSWKKGYMKGQPDTMIMNCHPLYSGFCLEFKSPTNNYHTSDAQKETKNSTKVIITTLKSTMIMTLLSNVYLNTWKALESHVNIVKSRSFQRKHFKRTLKLFIGLI